MRLSSYPHRAARHPLHRPLLAATAVIFAGLGCFAATPAVPAPLDMEEARAVIDSLGADGPQGIWLFPDDNVTVTVIAVDGDGDSGNVAHRRFAITVTESADADCLPGDLIGELEETAEAGKYRMTLFDTVDPAELLSLRRPDRTTLLAELAEEGEVLRVKAGKWKVRFNPSALLKGFTRLIRLQHDDPVGKLPAGMIRIYPSYDGNGSSRRKPRIL